MKIETVLQFMMDAFNMQVYIADLETHALLFVNEYTATLFGSDIRGMKCYEALHRGRSTPCESCTNNRLLDQNGLPCGTYEWEYNNATDGRSYRVWDKAIPWLDGRYARMGIVMDITDRKEVAAVLWENQERHRALFKNTVMPITIWDMEMRLLSLNSTAAHNMGGSPAALVGKSLSELVPGMVEVTVDRFRTIAETGNGMQVEDNIDLLSGTGTWFRTELQPIKDGHGSVVSIQLISEDFSERRRVEKDLQEHSERLFALTESSSDGIVLMEEGIIKEANASFFSMTGYSYDEIVGISGDKMLAPESKKRVHRIIRTNYKGRYEVKAIKKDGTIFEVEAYGSPVNYHGRPARMIAMHDISERKQAVEALKESEEKLASIIRWTPDIIYRLDVEGNIVFISDSVKKYGFNPQELEGRSFFGLLHPEDRKKARYKINERRTGDRRTKSLEVRILTPNNGEVVFESLSKRMETVVLIEAEGFYKLRKSAETKAAFKYQFVGTQGVARDITEKKKAEEELNGIKNYLDSVINSMPTALIGIDPQCRITQLNQKAEKISGISQKEARGNRLIDVLPQLKQETGRIQKALRERRLQKNKKTTWKENGETRYFDIIVYPLVSNGVEGAVVKIDDITERVRLEEMMIQTEKMMSLGGLTAGMAHEINNPLGGILQGAQILIRRIDPDFKKNREVANEIGIDLGKTHLYLQKRGIVKVTQSIRESGIRAANIISDMLKFSRKSQSERNPVNLRDILENALDLAGKDFDLKKKFDFRNIEIVRQLDKDMPFVCCIETQIGQVVLNILTNAAQAMASRVSDQRKPPKILLKTGVKDRMAIMEIEDNGPGMDEQTRKRIFEPFFTTKPPGQGTGLGLSVSYMIITNNHKGTMAVESEPGKGTKFIIALPLENGEGSFAVPSGPNGLFEKEC